MPSQDNRANSDNPAVPPQGNGGHSTTTANSAATLNHDNRAPSQGNGGQPLTDSNVDLTTQLTNFFCQFMPVTGQSETTSPTRLWRQTTTTPQALRSQLQMVELPPILAKFQPLLVNPCWPTKLYLVGINP